MPVLYESYSPGEEKTVKVILEGTATTKFDHLTVKTDIGEYDILAGAVPKARYGANVFILASMKNVGDLPATCVLRCEYPIGTPLYEFSEYLEPGAACGVSCLSHGGKYPIVMPATDITVKVTCSP